MANVEDILYEAHNLGLYDKVMKESRKLAKKHPHMEVGDRMEKALTKVKGKILHNMKGLNKNYGV